MEKINLHDKFLESLHEKISNKKQLVDTVSEILRIEKEPVYRRLNGKVLFSVQEMGILAIELGIVIDSLLFPDKGYQWIPFLLESPLGASSIDDFCDLLENKLFYMEKVTQEPSAFGSIFHVLPLELYAQHPYLMKFMFFKWGHYFVGSETFNNFSEWVVTERILEIKEKINQIFKKINTVLYIWDESLIWTLTSEINYLYKIQAISSDDKNLIKNDLKIMLTQLEKHLRGNSFQKNISENLEFYISHINVGTTSLYLASETKQLSFLQTSFSFSQADESYENFVNIQEWVHSFKKIASLISGSGNLERRLFFKKQHRIIDLFLG